MKKRIGFTLAEVLITLGIVGVVAALTIPTLTKNINSRVKKTQVEVVNKKLTEGMQLLSAAGGLGPYYESTEDFVRNGLSKHLKIVTICKQSELNKCMTYDQLSFRDGTTKTLSSIKDGNDIGALASYDSNYTSDNVGIVLANGTPMILNFNLNCPISDPETRNNTPLACLVALYDINGSRKPNTRGEDILGINTFGKAFVPTPITKSECEKIASTHGITACNYDNDYWAGAVKQCGGVWNLPTDDQLTTLAQIIYEDPTLTYDYKDTPPNRDKVPSNLSGLTSSWSYLWSGHEYSAYYAYNRLFHSSYTCWTNRTRYNSSLSAVCVGD